MLYQAYADEIDVEWGHGTHVCGSVAGNAATDTNGINEFRGLASDAKLAFVDISLVNVCCLLPSKYLCLFRTCMFP